jgi:hypothetical protein
MPISNPQASTGLGQVHQNCFFFDFSCRLSFQGWALALVGLAVALAFRVLGTRKLSRCEMTDRKSAKTSVHRRKAFQQFKGGSGTPRWSHKAFSFGHSVRHELKKLSCVCDPKSLDLLPLRKPSGDLVFEFHFLLWVSNIRT